MKKRGAGIKGARKRKRFKLPDYAPHAFRTPAQAAAEYRAVAAAWERIYVTGGTSEAAKKYPPSKREKALWSKRAAKMRQKAEEVERS